MSQKPVTLLRDLMAIALEGHGPRLGNIPACARITSRPAGPSPPSREHPRMRGDHFLFWKGTSFVLGTSPRMRGSRSVGALLGDLDGNIPAHAGTTSL